MPLPLRLPWTDRRKIQEFLPQADELEDDARRIRAMVKLFCGVDELSTEEKVVLRAHWEMPDERIKLPGNAPDQIAQITHQATDVLSVNALHDMDRAHIRSVRNTMRSIILLGTAFDIEIDGMEGAYDAIRAVPAKEVTTDEQFLQKIADHEELEVVTIGHILDLGMMHLILIAGAPDYAQVQRLRQELAILGIEIDLTKAKNDEADQDEKQGGKIMARGQYNLMYEIHAPLEKMFVDSKGEATPIDISLLKKLAAKGITKLGPLLAYTVQNLTKLSLSEPERARVIFKLALEGVVLKNALPNPFDLNERVPQ